MSIINTVDREKLKFLFKAIDGTILRSDQNRIYQKAKIVLYRLMKNDEQGTPGQWSFIDAAACDCAQELISIAQKFSRKAEELLDISRSIKKNIATIRKYGPLQMSSDLSEDVLESFEINLTEGTTEW